MILYDGGTAPNPRRVQIFLQEKDIVVDEVVQVDIHKLEHKTDAIKAKNYFRTVPFLELDDGTVISETMAICRYFEEEKPQPALFGEGSVEKAQVEMWNRRVELNFFMPVAHAVRHLHPKLVHLEKVQVKEWGELNKLRAAGFLKILDRRLSEGEFIMGDKISVADITAIVSCQFMKLTRIQIPEECQDLLRWIEAMESRPGIKFNAGA